MLPCICEITVSHEEGVVPTKVFNVRHSLDYSCKWNDCPISPMLLSEHKNLNKKLQKKKKTKLRNSYFWGKILLFVNLRVKFIKRSGS